MERGILCLHQYCREVCSAVCPAVSCYPAWQTYGGVLHPLCYEPVFLSSSSWHVQRGCCTPTPQPDMQPGHCSSTHPRLAARKHSHLLSLDFPGVITLWRGTEQWPFNMGRGEKGHIEGNVAVILITEVIYKDVNLYFLIIAYFCLHIF